MNANLLPRAAQQGMPHRLIRPSAVGAAHRSGVQGAPHASGAAGAAMLSTFPFAKCCNITMLDLQLFAGGGDGAVGGASAAPAAEGATASGDSAAAGRVESGKTGEQLSRAARRQAQASGEKAAVKHPLSTVQYGKDATQQAAADGNSTTKTGSDAKNTTSEAASEKAKADKNADFEKMIRGEYKEQFAARAQNMINQRFKETKQLEAKSQTADALMSRLAKRYGVNANDTAAILRAAEADESYTEKEANTRGLSVDEMRRVKQLESENAQLRSSAQQREAKDAAQKLYRTWMTDGEKLKQVYPDFDLKTEVKNPAFAQLIKSGVPLRKAYEANHLEQILGGAMQYTADQVAKGMAARIADRSSRPAENGTTPHAGAVVKPDVAGLSRADREEIERRVMRGEQILF